MKQVSFILILPSHDIHCFYCRLTEQQNFNHFRMCFPPSGANKVKLHIPVKHSQCFAVSGCAYVTQFGLFSNSVSSLRFYTGTPWCKAILEKLLSFQLLRHLWNPTVDYSCSQDRSSGPPIPFLYDVFQYFWIGGSHRGDCEEYGNLEPLLTLRSWRRRRYFPPKHLNFSELHDTTHEILFLS